MKILYVTTISNTVNAFLIPHIKMLIDQGNQVDVAFHIVQEVKPELIALGCKVYNVEFQRSPLKLKNYSAYKKLKNIIINENYDLIHTHTPVASACVRLACKKMKNIKVLYTAHGFHFFKGAPSLNWLVYYPIEKWLARYTDILITINKEDYSRAKKSLKAGRIEYIPGVGIDIDKFNQVEIDINLKRKELGLPKDAFVALSIGELNKNKNHEVVIRALSTIKNQRIHYIICGQGKLDEYLKNLSVELGLKNQVHFLGYRTDINEIIRISDLFVFPSFREGLSVSLMEAMSNGLPIVCSDIRGNSDLIEDGKGGFLISPDDINGFAKAICKIYESEDLISKFRTQNLERIHFYSLEKVLERLKQLYLHF